MDEDEAEFIMLDLKVRKSHLETMLGSFTVNNGWGNYFDDFIASAQFLISTGYTGPERLCIEGGSNGGLLVAACINQLPDLFVCALAHVGVMDMLRFHMFTIGHVCTSEFGCSNNKEDFRWLINVQRPWGKYGDRDCQYPPIMLLTADHDDHVVPLHSLKLLATLEQRVETLERVIDAAISASARARTEKRQAETAQRAAELHAQEVTRELENSTKVFKLHMEELRSKQEEISKKDQEIKLLEDIIQTLSRNDLSCRQLGVRTPM